MGLYDAALVKENHIASAGSIENAVNSLKSKGIQLIEVEVESLHQIDEAINSGANIAMLDNFDDDNLNKASEIARGKIKLEVSGNIDLSQINKLKKLNIDYISSGDLTKNISATDYSLIFEKLIKTDVLIIGSGAAGMTAAIELSKNFEATLISKNSLVDSSTWYAQGGIAVVIDEKDSIEEHLRDTLIAGDGLCNIEAVRECVSKR